MNRKVSLFLPYMGFLPFYKLVFPEEAGEKWTFRMKGRSFLNGERAAVRVKGNDTIIKRKREWVCKGELR